MTCECGSIFRASDKKRHEDTNKHKEYLKINDSSYNNVDEQDE